MKPYRFPFFFTIVLLFICVFNQSIPYSLSDSNYYRTNIIPQPRQVTDTKSPQGAFEILDDDWTVFVESTADETTRLAAELITKDLNNIWGLNISLRIDDKALASAEKSIILGIPKRDKKIDALTTNKAITLNQDSHPQGYKISVTPNWTGPGKILLLANTSQGLFYAAQTFRQMIAKDKANQIILPPVVIDDWPLLDYRGVQITIGEGIKIDYIKKLIHLLAYYKINILSLQESNFTEEQIAELIKEASTYQINLSGNIHTIKPGNFHHICLKKWCGHLGKKPLGWIDSVLKEQRFLSKIPKTTIIMNTLEEGNSLTIGNYFEQIESFTKNGLEQILCPRTIIKGNILPDIQAIHKNIYTASQAGLRHLDNNHKIMGLVFCSTSDNAALFIENMIEPIIFTAECGWIPDRTDADIFNGNLNHSLFGVNGNEAKEILDLLSSCHQLINANNLSEYIFTDPFKSKTHLNTRNFYASLRKIKSIADETLGKISALQEKSVRSEGILDVWRYTASQWQVFAERFLLARKISNKYHDHYDERYTFEYAPIKTDYQTIKKDYEELFDKTSKEFDTLREEYKTLINQRYDINGLKVTEPFETARTIWQDKSKRISEAIMSGNFPTPDQLDISLAKAPQRLVIPAIKSPHLRIEKAFTWWDSRLHYRVLVTMENTMARPAIGKELFAYPFEIQINFTELLKESGAFANDTADIEFNPQSVRVIEYSSEGTPLIEVPYQMDKTKKFNPNFNAHVNLTWIIRNPIEAKSIKYFYVYFDIVKNQAPRYKPEYPYGELSTSGTDMKGYWLKNSRFKVELSLTPDENNQLISFSINSWVIRNFSTGFFTHLNLIRNKGKGFAGILFAKTDGKLSLQKQVGGPLLSRFHTESEDSDGYLFYFYENMPICEIFTENVVHELHNSYLIPKSYFKTALNDKTSNFSGADYISSNYTKEKILPEHPLKKSLDDSFWLSQKIVNGLTIAALTPEKSVTHYLITKPENQNISVSFGVDSAKPLYHFIIYADITNQDTFELMNQIKSVFTLENPPIIQRTRAEKSPL